MKKESQKIADEFVQLGRTFNELSSYASQSDDIDIEKAPHVKTLAWDDLVREYRTVILSAAGSGKTQEIKQQAMYLRAEGKPSFFLRLENIPSGYDHAFEIGSPTEFQKWMEGTEDGWLFLDSVDEARLRHPRDFEKAIAKIGALLGPAKERAHIVVTGRTTAWRPKSDLNYCAQHLPKNPIVVSAPALESAPDIEAFDDENGDAVKPEEKENRHGASSSPP
jgi:hypothetical protein